MARNQLAAPSSNTPLMFDKMGRHNSCLPTPDSIILTDQNTDTTTKSNLVNQWVFIEVAYNNMSERLFTGAEITQRQLYHQRPPQHGGQLSKAGALEHIAQPVLSSIFWRVSFSRCLRWSNPLPGSSTQSLLTASFLSKSSLQLGSSSSDRERPSESD